MSGELGEVSDQRASFDLNRRPVPRDDALGLIMSIAIHLVGGWIFLEASSPDQTIKEEVLAVEMVALTALGEPPPPNALPRIVAPSPPPEPSSEEVSVSRVIEEKEKPKKKPKKKLKKKPKKKPKEPSKRKRKSRRKVSKNDLFSGLSNDDSRADKGPRRGDRRGSIEGTSTKWNDGVVNAYISRVSRNIRLRFKPPASIDKRKLSKLSVEVNVRLKPAGQRVAHIVNSLRCKRCSGNKFFDDAAIRALKVFTEEGGAKLPLPKSKEERKTVLKRGFSITLNGKDMM